MGSGGTGLMASMIRQSTVDILDKLSETSEEEHGLLEDPASVHPGQVRGGSLLRRHHQQFRLGSCGRECQTEKKLDAACV